MRILVLCALLFLLAWPVRGQFGHLHGATVPGAFAVLAAMVSSRGIWFQGFGAAAILSIAGFAVGGTMGYARTIEGIVYAPSLLDALPGFADIFLTGALWGGIGLTGLGYGCSERGLGRVELAALLLVALAWSILLGPLHRDSWTLGVLGGSLIVLHAANWMGCQSRVVTIFGLAGVIGFGLAFVIAVGLLRLGWNVRDQTIGVLGGLALGLAIRAAGRRGLAPPHEPASKTLQYAGLLAILVGVPAVNTLNILGSWHTERPVPSWVSTAVSAASIIGYGLLAHWAFGRSRRGWFYRDSAHELCRRATLVLIWLLPMLAIAKELIPIGLQRWEMTYTLFVLTALALTVVLKSFAKSK